VLLGDRRVVRIAVRAPATTANLGAGFDCAAVALDLWNEVVVTDAGTPDRTHLGVQAFERIAPADGLRFEFYDRIPRERGLGSSAAVIALGLVAGAHLAGREPDPEWLLHEGLPLEGHADNLAAVLAGGACLTSDGRIHRIADDVPGVPIALVPETTVATAEARAVLPEQVPLGDAVFTVGRAALLGAGLASGSETIFASSLDDRVHEPYRAPHAPLLADVRNEPPTGALGATISGSGPTVIVWAHPHQAKECSVELSNRFPDVEVLWLSTSPKGAEVLT
jgi:homoserine kinase